MTNTTTGDTLKVRGQSRALRRAGSKWLRVALDEFRHWLWGVYIAGSRRVTLDEFRADGRCPEPAHHNAWGALPLQALRIGWLDATNNTAKARHAAAHSRRVRVWAINPEMLTASA